mmetsp:Transcript_20878/g.58595  ORF Transcript_20878/g.58595 Transcript_20878/m.58595 type:complete len:212 (-) Transcript_20878:37-672(-)
MRAHLVVGRNPCELGIVQSLDRDLVPVLGLRHRLRVRERQRVAGAEREALLLLRLRRGVVPRILVAAEELEALLGGRGGLQFHQRRLAHRVDPDELQLIVLVAPDHILDGIERHSSLSGLVLCHVLGAVDLVQPVRDVGLHLDLLLRPLLLLGVEHDHAAQGGPRAAGAGECSARGHGGGHEGGHGQAPCGHHHGRGRDRRARGRPKRGPS